MNEEPRIGTMNRRDFAKMAAVTLSSATLPVAGLATAEPEAAIAGRDGRAVAASNLISPLIGASTSVKLGEGKTFPGATTPFGMVQLSPDTITGGDNAPGYSYEHTSIEGFSFTLMSGVGWFGDFDNLMTMPTTGKLKTVCGRPDRAGEGWRSRFDHAHEVAEAGYYATTLEDYRIRAEMTASPYAGILRFTYPQAEQARIQVDLSRRIGGTSTRQHVKMVNDHTIEGWMECPEAGGGWGDGAGHVNYTMYFRTEFSMPMMRHGVWSVDLPASFFEHKAEMLVDKFSSDAYYELAAKAEVLEGVTEQTGVHLGFYAEFVPKADGLVLAKSGISFVDLEGARKNLEHDIPHWDFDQVRQQAKRQWSEAIGKIKIEGANEAQRKIFATAMYHAMIDPRKISDSDGRYLAADGKIEREQGFTHRTVFSGWDVFRAELPLMSIIHPSLVNDQICSLLELAEKSGKGYLERWEIMNAYSGCMDGDPAIAVILDAHSKGIRKFDIHKAYAACRQTAAGSGSKTNRPENDFYMANGYVPNQVSWTLDNAYFDWCVSRLAEAVGERDDAALFKTRALNYQKIYDPQVQSMRARQANGEWLEWKGSTEFGQGCTESNPLQQSWFVPHDVYGLITRMGAEHFCGSLEEMFEKTPDSFGWNPHYNHSNEPVHHIAYLFVYAGKPWLTQKWVRRILNQAYHAEVSGIVGNDDVGQMSAWYVLSALGFYPVCPGDGIYILGAPLFERSTIRLSPEWHKGLTFTVVAKGNSKENCYVQSARLNGQPYTRAWIRHEDVIAGGTLEFVMGPAANEQWGIAAADLPPDLMKPSAVA